VKLQTTKNTVSLRRWKGFVESSGGVTDGCPGLQSMLAEAGITTPPIADWFHIAMRLQHAKQAASRLSTDEPRRTRAKTAIVAEVERLHWRIWSVLQKHTERSSP
jgi:hypothetical protein